MVVIDNFNNSGWTVPVKKRNAQTIKVSFENILMNSKRKPNLIETNDGSEFMNKIFSNFLNKINLNRYSRYTSLGAVVAERFNRTLRGLPKKPVFEKRDGHWVDVLPTITKQY